VDPSYRTRLFSTTGKIAGIAVVGLALYAVLSAVGEAYTGLPAWLIRILTFAVVLPLLVWAIGAFVRPIAHTLSDLSDGIRNFYDRDFSVRIATARTDELGELIRLYNEVAGILQGERAQIRQRELLLQGALDQSPIAIVLVSPLRRVAYANHEARRLFLREGRLQGTNFDEVLDGCPSEMRDVLESGADGIFTLETEEQPETYHLSRRQFHINQRRYMLYLVRRMTQELARREVEIWKKVIRIISHELNNSLAPISSLAHSGSLLAKDPDQVHRLEPVHDAIRERIDHLSRFLEGYAKFARLPRPRREDVDWNEWLDAPRRLYDFRLEGAVPSRPGYFDPSQLQQVLINLLKNATEASDGEPDITVRIDRLPDRRVRVQVLDRGRGMTEDVMRNALVPFYSTKKSGTGVGLPLCREIVEAHGGSLRIQNRENGGTAVSFALPPKP
jgi:nitrogen fixation/metabolism regulation signal transduction histidine kinase